jgi:hypothetical protein
MKRTGFKKRSRSLNRVSKQPISKLQKEIWELLRQIAKIIYPNNCYTCDAKNLIGSNCQLGHLWAKASLGAFLKYDLRLLRWQCMRCNCHLGGQGAIFYARLLEEKGKEFMAQLEKDRQITVKAYDHYLKLKEDLTKLLADLTSKRDSVLTKNCG